MMSTSMASGLVLKVKMVRQPPILQIKYSPGLYNPQLNLIPHIYQFLQTLCIQSLKLLLNHMSDTLRNCSTPSPIYGFLCEQTNVFYAFETQEQYQEFLDWVQASAQPNALAPTDDMITEEELQYNFDRATENIMEVFEDPLFKTRDVQMELEEIDF